MSYANRNGNRVRAATYPNALRQWNHRLLDPDLRRRNADAIRFVWEAPLCVPASLPDPAATIHDSDRDKQKPPGEPTPEGFTTDTYVTRTDGRYPQSA